MRKIKHFGYNNFLYSIIGIILTIALLITFLTTKKENTINVPDLVIQKVLRDTNTVFKKNVSKFNAKASFSLNNSVWWNTDDGYSIINHQSPGVTFEAECHPNSQVETIKKNIAPQIRQRFLKDEFTINKTNTSNSYNDSQFYDYVEAYEKGSIKCTVTINPDCGSSTIDGPLISTLSVNCTNNYKENMAFQEPILKSLSLKNNIIDISKISGEFMYLDIHGRRSGYYMVVKTSINGFEKLVSSQEEPPCSIVNKFKIPSEIIDSCYQNNKLIQNNN